MKSGASPATIAAALCADRPVLSELKVLFPEAWEAVSRELHLLAELPDPARAAATLTEAHREWQEIRPRCLSLKAHFNSRLAAQCGLCLIRKLALEQYCHFLQLETVKAGGGVGLRDRLLFRLLILPLALRRRALPYRLHRFAWLLLQNRPAVSAMLLRSGCYLIAPKELINGLAALIGDRPTLEIGAGRGILAACLRHAGVNITAVDDFSWADRLPIGRDVQRLDGGEALSRYQPQVVICCWPPPGNSFERKILASPRVQDYIVIASRHRHASGDHQAYAGAKGFRCVQATGMLAAMLLPSETESLLYVFSRRDISEFLLNS